MTSSVLDKYEPLHVIGNSIGGVIRKVQRKTDGLVRAYFRVLRFTGDIRAQGTQLGEDEQARYKANCSRNVRYCGGGDLFTIIKKATKQNLPLHEDTTWHYFPQIL